MMAFTNYYNENVLASICVERSVIQKFEKTCQTYYEKS